MRQTLRGETGRIFLPGIQEELYMRSSSLVPGAGLLNPWNFPRGGVREASLSLVTPLSTAQEFMPRDDQTAAVTQAAPS